MRNRGFTLAELLVAMTIGAILLAQAAPGLVRHRGEAALRTAASQTLAALQLARRLALARGQSVTVCPSADGAACGFGGSTWLLFANAPGGTDGHREAADELLQSWEVPAGILVTGTRGYAAFQPQAGTATTVTFQFCHRAVPGEAVSIVISQTGRPRVTRSTSGATCQTG
ncbi:MAG TPA: GspH/FimT family pseudopilin [Steroidobacteraceae bacterium]|nr:GspH/FimT family pseudopilin [Steroidobacteraceae bacterium]